MSVNPLPRPKTYEELILDRLDSIDHRLNRLGEDRNVAQLEKWLTKRELSKLLGPSPRWLDDRIKEGMPFRELANKHMFRLSQVEPWLREHGYLREVPNER